MTDDLSDFLPRLDPGEEYLVDGKVRTACKKHRCIGADELLAWQVERKGDGRSGVAYYYIEDGDTPETAQEKAEADAERLRTLLGYEATVLPIETRPTTPAAWVTSTRVTATSNTWSPHPLYKSGSRYCAVRPNYLS